MYGDIRERRTGYDDHVSAPGDARRLLELKHEIAARCAYPFDAYFPETGPLRRGKYLKQMEFFAAGALYKERLLMAANRVGKTDAGAYEMTCHLTGVYPFWWAGRTFDTAVEAWASGTTAETTRDIIQSKLLGPWKSDMGGDAPYAGMIPRHLIVGTSRRPHGIPGAIETVWVRHASGGVSMLGLKSYIQGRESYEGTAKGVVWFDEEPPGDIYTEGLYRTLTTKGIVYTTFTPLQGMSEVVTQFLEADDAAKASKIVIQAGWNDVPHLDPTERALLLASTPPYQRAARTTGTPTLGAGAIYALPEEELTIADFPIPKHWKRVWGGDAGGGAKPTAVVWLALDPDLGMVYLYSTYKRESPEPAIHLAGIKARGAWIPGVMDSAALIVSRDDAEQLVSVYNRGGLTVTLPDKAVESGIQSVWELMSEQRFRVFKSCEPWFAEFRKYHRDKKGRIVKVDDHLMDATRYAVYSGLVLAKNEADITVARRTSYQPAPIQGGGGTGYMGS